MLKNTKLVVLLSLLTISVQANAEVYKSTDANGRITYTDQPTNNADKVNTKATSGINAVKPATAKAANTQHTNTTTNSAFTATSNAFPSSKTSSTSTAAAASGGGASSAGGGVSASGGGVSASAAKPASATAATTTTSTAKSGAVSATATSKAGLVAAANAATAALAKANTANTTAASTTTASSSAAKTVAPVTTTTAAATKTAVPVTAAAATAPVVAAAAVKPVTATTTAAVVATATVTPVAALTNTSTAAAQSTTPVTQSATAPVVKAATVVAAVSTANVAKAVSSSSVAVSSTAPVVINASISVKPGDVAGLQGENFGADPSVFLESNSGGAATQLPVFNKFENGWISFRVPADAVGAIVVRVSNGSETSAPVFLNAAKAYHLDAMQIVPQGVFRVFGRNLLVSGFDPVVKVGGQAATVNKTLSDEYMLTVTAPSGLVPTKNSVITVDNGNGSGPYQLDRAIEVVTGATGDPFVLGVGWAAGFSSFSSNVINAKTDSRLKQKAICDGVADDTVGIRGAIEIASKMGGGVVQLPAGTCRMVTNGPVYSKVVLQGAGKNNTIIKSYTNGGLFIDGADLAGIRNLTIVNQGGVVIAPSIKNSTRVFYQNVKFDLAGSNRMGLINNTNFLVSGCDFLQPYNVLKNTALILNGSSGVVFKGNSIFTAQGQTTAENVHDAYLQGNRFTRDAARSGVADGAYHALSIDFSYRIAIVGNTFDVVNGPVTNRTRNDGETILSEGGGARRTENLGLVAYATADSITDPLNVINVMPVVGLNAIPENYGLAIVGGKGAGQSRRVIAYSAGKLTVDHAWDVIPDSTSRYSTFMWGLEKSLIKGNILSQNPRGIWMYKTAVREVDIIGNQITEGGGIYLKSTQSLKEKIFVPIYGVKVSQNVITNTNRIWNSYINSSFARIETEDFGIAQIGIEIADNKVIANVPNLALTTEDLAGASEGISHTMVVQGLRGAETQTRLLGSMIQRNVCTHCAEAVKLGIGLKGTVVDKNTLVR